MNPFGPGWIDGCIDPQRIEVGAYGHDMSADPSGPAGSSTQSQSSLDSSNGFTLSLEASSFTTPDGGRGRDSEASSPTYQAADAFQADMGPLDNDMSLSAMGSWSRSRELELLGHEVDYSPFLNGPDSGENQLELSEHPPDQGETQPPMAQLDQCTDPRTERLHHAAIEIYRTITLIDSNAKECNQARLLQTQQYLDEIYEHISSRIQSPGKPEPETAFSCLKCPATLKTRGCLTRHVQEMHYPKFRYRCLVEDCPADAPRRSRIMSHMRNRHLRHATAGEIDKHAEPLPHKPSCCICRGAVQSWDKFYKCFVEHCITRARVPIESPHRQTSAVHGIGRTNDSPNDSRSSGMSRGNSRRSRTGQSSRRAQTHRQWPESSVNGFNVRDRTREAAPGRHQSPQCNLCRHFFTDCGSCRHQRESRDGCHMCPRDRAAIRADRRARPGPHTLEAPTDPGLTYTQAMNPLPLDYPESALGSDPTHLNLDPLPNDSGFDVVNYIRANLINRGNDTGVALTDDPLVSGRGNNVQARAVIDLYGNFLNEQETECSFALDAKNPRTKDILTILPSTDFFKKWLYSPLQGPSMLALNGLPSITDTKQWPASVVNPSPQDTCQCLCRQRTLAQLAPGRQVELFLEFSPPGKPEHIQARKAHSHPLRTRVSIVVKLFRLRSSVALPSKNDETRQALAQAFEPTLGGRVLEGMDNASEASEDSDSESETDSVFSEDALSLSSSVSDLESPSLTRPASPACSDIDLIDPLGK